jgi:hypothetical protein
MASAATSSSSVSLKLSYNGPVYDILKVSLAPFPSDVLKLIFRYESIGPTFALFRISSYHYRIYCLILKWVTSTFRSEDHNDYDPPRYAQQWQWIHIADTHYSNFVAQLHACVYESELYL